MTRRTSILAYNTIKNNGLLSKRRMQVYDVVYHHGPMTATQCWKRMPEATWKEAVCARLSELVRIGVVEEVGETKCSTTNQTVLVFDVTPNLPTKLTCAKSKLAKAKERISFLENEVKELKEELRKATGKPVRRPIRTLL